MPDKFVNLFIKTTLIFVVILSLLSCANTPKLSQSAGFARAGLEHIKSFSVVFSKVAAYQLAPFDLAIVEHEFYNAEELNQLQQNHKTIIAYLNIGELETYREYAEKISPQCLLGKNPDWPDHYFIAPSCKQWQKLLLQEIIPAILAKGFNGLFLDSVDMAVKKRFPQYKKQMIQLIQKIYVHFPNIFLIVNNGQYILNEIISYVNGLLVEEVFSQQSKSGIFEKPLNESLQKLTQLKKLKYKTRIPIFVLDYITNAAVLSDDKKKEIVQRFGILFYITDKHAQGIYSENPEI